MRFARRFLIDGVAYGAYLRAFRKVAVVWEFQTDTSHWFALFTSPSLVFILDGRVAPPSCQEFIDGGSSHKITFSGHELTVSVWGSPVRHELSLDGTLLPSTHDKLSPWINATDP